MEFDSIKKKVKKITIILFPKLYTYYLRNALYSSGEVINDLSIHRTSEITYNPNGVYVTMFSTPPKHYKKTIESKIFDKKGIPLFILVRDTYYHPVSIIQYGLSEYGYWYTTNNENHLNNAINVAKWLVNHQNANGLWEYKFDYFHKRTGYILKAPWASAMAQGQGVSLLTRIYNVTKEENFFNAAIRATELLNIPVQKGGLCADFFGYKVYEEYPTIPPSFTLNGFCFCVFGLYDLCQLTDDRRVHALWHEAIKTIKFIIPFYDGDICRNYCLSHIFARKEWEKSQNEMYHIIHISLLQNLQSIIPDDIFVYYINKWANMFGVQP